MLKLNFDFESNYIMSKYLRFAFDNGCLVLLQTIAIEISVFSESQGTSLEESNIHTRL